MDRRKLLISMGSLAAGSAAALGTGAFTSVSASRSISVKTASDSDALLAIRPGATADYDAATNSSSTANAAYVSTANGQLQIDLDSDSGASGTGVNDDAVTDIDNLLHVVNQGTQTVALWVTESTSNDAVTFYDGTQGGPDAGSIEGQDNAVELEVGDALDVSLEVDTTDDVSDDPTSLSTVTFTADEGVSAGSGDVGGGQPTSGPVGSDVTVSGPFDDFASQAPTVLSNEAFDVRGKIGDAGGTANTEVEVRVGGSPLASTKKQLAWPDAEPVQFTLNYYADTNEVEFQIDGTSIERTVVSNEPDGRLAVQVKAADGAGTTSVDNLALGGESVGVTDGISKTYGDDLDGDADTATPNYAPERVGHLVLSGVDFNQTFTLTGDATLNYASPPADLGDEALAFDIILE